MSSSTPETVLAATTAARDTSLVSAELGSVTPARPRLRRNSSASRKQQQARCWNQGATATRSLGVAELERFCCRGDHLLELSAVVEDGENW